MQAPIFKQQGKDSISYAPFVLEDCLATQWADVRLSFDDWDWLQQRYGDAQIDDYYLNGYGLEGLIKAMLLEEGVDVESDAISFNSEGDTCYIHFKELHQAVHVATSAARMIASEQEIKHMIQLAREAGFEE